MYTDAKVMLNIPSKIGREKYSLDHCNNITKLLNLTVIEFRKFYGPDQIYEVWYTKEHCFPFPQN